MKKFYLFLVQLFVMSLCTISCGEDDVEPPLPAVVVDVFDNYKIVSNHEFEFSHNEGEMFFDCFNCVDNEDFLVSDLWDTNITNNKEKKDIFVYKVEEDTVFAVTKKDSATFNVKFSEVAHKYNNFQCYVLKFQLENQPARIFAYAFYYNGERWCSHNEQWHFRQGVIVE